MRLKIPEVLERFAAYVEKEPAWGSLHIVLEEGNHRDGHVRWCAEWALLRGDAEGVALAEILLRMTRSQRGRLDRKVAEFLKSKRLAEKAETWGGHEHPE